MKKRFAVFVSGYGNGAIEIIKDYKNGLIIPELSLILSSYEASYCLKVAEENNIPTKVIRREDFSKKSEYEEIILEILTDLKIDYIFLAGWKPIIGKTLLDNYSNKIVNIHPSLLPSFKGINAIDQAIDHGVKITGITTHFVDQTIDGGKIIDQKSVRINDDDTFNEVAQKIFNKGIILTTETINKVFI